MLFCFKEWTFQTNIASQAKPEMGDAMKSSFLAKHINNSLFIWDFSW